MADGKDSFPILEDVSGNGKPLSEAYETLSATSKVGSMSLVAKNPSGNFILLSADASGRLIISQTVVTQYPSLQIVLKKVLSASAGYYYTQAISNRTAIKSFSFGGRAAGEATLAKYVDATESYVPGGNFESSGDVALWSQTSLTALTAPSPDYSTLQAFTGTGSMRWIYSKSDINNYPEMTYNWATPQDLSSWRYVTARFYNDAPTGGAVTRNISVILTSGTAKRFYTVSGLTSASPFNATGWIQILGQLENPTSETGTGFDITSVNSISLRLQDSGNKAGTVYWDTVKLKGEITFIDKIYVASGSTIPVKYDPVNIFEVGETLLLIMKNNSASQSSEFLANASGVDIT